MRTTIRDIQMVGSGVVAPGALIIGDRIIMHIYTLSQCLKSL